MRLSEADRKILDFVIYNGAHFSDYAIAEKLRISQTTVNYNMRRLKDNGVILGYKYRVDPVKAGYPLMAWIFIRITSRAEINSLVYKVLSHNNVFDVLIMAGPDDLIVKCYFRNNDEFNSLLKWMGGELKGEIEMISTAIATKIHKVHQYSLGDSKPVKLSANEKKILQLRISEPEITVNEIAARVKCHRNTVAALWKKMWREKIVLKKTPVISPAYFEELGVDFKAVVLMNIPLGSEDKSISGLCSFKEIHEMTSIAHQKNLLAVIRLKDLYNAYKLIKKIYSSKLVESTETYPIFRSFTKDVNVIQKN